MKVIPWAALLLTLIGRVADAKTPDGWEYIGTDRNVTLYKKTVEGSDLVAFRGVTYADLHIGKLYGVLREPKERPNWVDRYANDETYIRTAERQVYWIHFGLPWPVSDRDYVLESVAKLDPERGRVTVNIESTEHEKKPPDDCCVRAIVKRTYYEFTAIPGEEKTKLIVEVHTDPKGSLPTWLVNLIQKTWPSKTLDGLVQRTRALNPEPFAPMATWHEATVVATPKPESEPASETTEAPAPVN